VLTVVGSCTESIFISPNATDPTNKLCKVQQSVRTSASDGSREPDTVISRIKHGVVILQELLADDEVDVCGSTSTIRDPSVELAGCKTEVSILGGGDGELVGGKSAAYSTNVEGKVGGRFGRPAGKTSGSIGLTSGCTEEGVVSSSGDEDEGSSSVDNGVGSARERRATKGYGGDGDTPELAIRRCSSFGDESYRASEF